MQWEIQIIKHIQAYQNGFFDMFFWLISIFSSILGIILIFFLLFFLFKKLFSFIFLFCSFFSISTCYILKNLINRPRPYQIDFEIINKTNAIGKSYPSGHMITGTTLVFFLTIFAFKKFKKTWQKVVVTTLGFCYEILLVMSRMYFGQHFITDLVVGYILGIVINFSLYLVFEYYCQHKG